MHGLRHQLRKSSDYTHKLCIPINVVVHGFIEIALQQQCVGAGLVQACDVDAFHQVSALLAVRTDRPQVNRIFVQLAC